MTLIRARSRRPLSSVTSIESNSCRAWSADRTGVLPRFGRGPNPLAHRESGGDARGGGGTPRYFGLVGPRDVGGDRGGEVGRPEQAVRDDIAVGSVEDAARHRRAEDRGTPIYPTSARPRLAAATPWRGSIRRPSGARAQRPARCYSPIRRSQGS